MQDADALLPLQHAQVRHGAARCCATGMRPLSTLSMKPQTNIYRTREEMLSYVFVGVLQI